LEAFGIEYEDIEVNLTNWKVKKMLKQVITKDIAPFRMYKFYSNFEIMDTKVWLDLSFEQASNLKEHMVINITCNEKSSTIDPTNVASTS
jgi:hypothetical protein